MTELGGTPERPVRIIETEQLIAVLDGNVLNWPRLARSADPATAIGYRELAADDLMLALEHSRRLHRMMAGRQRIAAPAKEGARARRRSLSSILRRAARTARTAESTERSVETGDPPYAERRALNIAKGRALARPGFFRWLCK